MGSLDEFTPDTVRKMIRCAPTLPAPGPEVVKSLGEAWLRLYEEYMRVSEERRNAREAFVLMRTAWDEPIRASADLDSVRAAVVIGWFLSWIGGRRFLRVPLENKELIFPIYER